MLIIFDKDGTLALNPDESRPANTLDEAQYFPDVEAKCKQLRDEGHILAVASNQGGVAFGFMSREAAHALVKHAADTIGAVAYAVCVVHPKGRKAEARRESEFRKPNGGMIRYLMDALGFSAADTLYVGDMESDREAAQDAGVKFVDANTFFGRQPESPPRR